MTENQVTYLVFGIVLVIALVLDLGLLSKKGSQITMRKALYQTLFWVGLSVAFFAYLWVDKGSGPAVKYILAYLMEWSLSIDNIFVFILIFTFFKVTESDAGRALLIGILLAIVFRIVFIAVGIELVERFHWVLYIFGAFLVYTGFKLFSKGDEEEFNPGESKIYRMITRFFRVSPGEAKGKYIIRENGKTMLTSLAVVVFILAATDIVFALDSIPVVLGVVKEVGKELTDTDTLVIYSSNIFAVLGLRSLFFLMRGAVSKFDFLQQGIAIVLIFIGLKMLVEYFNVHVPIWVSLLVIVACLGGSIWYSQYHRRKNTPADFDDGTLDL
ncbi:MAG TPA: TerC/Alx family metal homeostasis membrane protein [Flavisolibacter sp.]|nr:TerC/Alx family metal homeostasis membrane protein [Flavisolibacter sp.]